MKTVAIDIPVSPDSAIVWKNDTLYLLDQRVLPGKEQFVLLQSADDTRQAIADMVVRGAPAIGVTAAYGVVLAAREVYESHGNDWKNHIEAKLESLEQARPTAVNLAWAISKMRSAITKL